MTATLPAWPPATATGVGSMPGSSAREATRIVVGELGDLVHVVELPARGPGADIVGRTAGLLTGVDSALGLETTPTGWRVAGSANRQMRLAAALLGEDLDALEEVTDGFAGTVKCQVAGPWTLAAAVELRTGERMLRDPVAVGDLAQALAAAVADHVAEVRRRMPGAAAVVVQLDEPSLAAVLAGRIGTASGLSTYAAVGEQVATGVLRTVVDAIHAVDALGVVHCCAGDPPVDIVRAAAVDGVSVDLTAIGDGVDEEIGRLLDARGTLLAGSVPALPVERLGDARASAPVRSLLDRLGMAGEEWLPQIVVTPTCGLAGAPPAWPRTALAACAAVGRVLRNDHGEDEAPSR